METYWNAGQEEVFEDGGKLNIEGCVQLRVASIKLTAAELRTSSNITLWSFSTTSSVLFLVPYYCL